MHLLNTADAQSRISLMRVANTRRYFKKTIVGIPALLISSLFLAADARMEAQQIAVVDASPNVLPDAPRPTGGAQSGQIGAASFSGEVVDQNGAPIGEARVKLLDGSGLQVGESGVDADGRFSFAGLPAGAFQVSASAPGFTSHMSDSVTLSSGQVVVVPKITLTVASESTEIDVTATREEIATAQIHAAEQQRVIGIFPNFFTSYIYDAVPLTTKQKYSLALRDTFDPVRFVTTGIGAGVEQANNSYKGYGQGAAGYGKRYAALYGDGLFSDVLSHAVFPSIFHQDPRYFYQGWGTLKSRAIHGISYAFVLRSDSGKTVPNYSYFLGDLSAGALSNLYYPHADRGADLVFRNAAIGIGGRAADGLIREFIVPYFTRHKAGKGKQ